MGFVPCEKCSKNNKGLPPGYYWVNNRTKLAAECECHRVYEMNQRVHALFRHYGFNDKYWDYNPRSYVGTKSLESKNRLINYITQFSQNPEVRKLLVYMYGPNGTQKTSLANFVGRELLKDGFVVRYILMNNLIADLQDKEFNQESADRVNKLKEADLLIIDEAMDKSKLTLYKSGYQQSFIDTFVRDRIQSQNKGILFISNVHPDNIAEQGLSISIQDFIQRECKVNNTLLTFEDNYVAESKLEYDSSKGLF